MVLIAIPFGVVIALHVGTFNRQVGAASATGAAMVLAIVREASPVATALLIAFEMVATPTIDDVCVGDIADDQATAIVRHDRVVETSQGTNEETGFYAELQLARIDGRWLVTNVLNLNFARGGGAADPGGTSTTTTAAPGP